MSLLLRAHVDDKPDRHSSRREELPRYAALLDSTGIEIHNTTGTHRYERPRNELVKILIQHCYKGTMALWKDRHGSWRWRSGLKWRAYLVAWDLPSEIARLGTLRRISKADGFVFTLAHHPDGNPNECLPQLEIRHQSEDGYSFQWRYPEHNTFRLKHHPGRFLNLSQLAFALRNERMTFATALNEWNAKDLWTLTNAMLAEFDALELPISADRVYSPAGLAKAALQAQKVRIPKVDPVRLGQAMSAFYGPRIEARIRKVVKPVSYLDFRAMYPTVQALLGNWRLLTAVRVQVKDYTAGARELLDHLDRDDLFKPEVWRELNGFALVEPDGDLLPVHSESLSTLAYVSGRPLWWALPDLAASLVLTGRRPRILEAWRLVPKGGNDDDYFVSLVERRKTEPHLSKFLKVLANAGAYGVFGEINICKSREVTLYGADGCFYGTSPEKPGRYYFPPIYSVITAGARLMLALLQSHVDEYVFCDTDSMAVVDGPDIEAIRAKFRALSPYSDGELLKLEDENFRLRKDGTVDRSERVQLYAYAIASKNYALFNIDDDSVTLRKRTESALGYLKPPCDGWIDDLWRYLIRRDGLESIGFGEQLPAWVDEPAINRVRIRTPHSWKQLGGSPFAYREEPLGCSMAKKTIGPLFADRDEPQFEWINGVAHHRSVNVDSVRYTGKETYQLDETHLMRNRVEYQERRCACGCGTALEVKDPRRLYASETHRKRVQRARLRGSLTPSPVSP